MGNEVISVPQIPIKLSESLYLAAELARKNEELEKELVKLRFDGEYPEVLQGHHIIKLMEISKSTLTMWAADPEFPHLDGGRKKGDAIRVRKVEFYEWLKNRKSREINQELNITPLLLRRLRKKAR